MQLTGRAAADGPVVRLQNASFGYGQRRIVTDIDLTVQRGEAVALLGANGSGKSTLVKGLLGLTDHHGGRVELLGVPLAQFRQRHLLGYVPQRHTLGGGVRATVREVVAIGRLPHHRLVPIMRAVDRRIVTEALDLVGLADAACDDVAHLSGGQQRRVLIARALAAQPEMLLMDEPTAGVDQANQQVLLTVLQRLVQSGTTLVVVTHELAALQPLLHRAVVVEAGRITYDGSVDGLVRGSTPLGSVLPEPECPEPEPPTLSPVLPVYPVEGSSRA